jgi:Sec-independent protein secretion pathway component TatC
MLTIKDISEEQDTQQMHKEEVPVVSHTAELEEQVLQVLLQLVLLVVVDMVGQLDTAEVVEEIVALVQRQREDQEVEDPVLPLEVELVDTEPVEVEARHTRVELALMVALISQATVALVMEVVEVEELMAMRN